MVLLGSLCDSSGHKGPYILLPTVPGRTYTFIIAHVMKMDKTLWDLVIRERANTIWSGEVSVNPYAPKVIEPS